MPIYEYQCTGCHHQFDLLQKIHDEPIKKCPECSKDTVVRLVSAVGFQLKGTGWYATDFKNKGKPETKSEHSKSPNSDSKTPKTETQACQKKSTEPASTVSATNNSKGDSN